MMLTLYLRMHSIVGLVSCYPNYCEPDELHSYFLILTRPTHWVNVAQGIHDTEILEIRRALKHDVTAYS